MQSLADSAIARRQASTSRRPGVQVVPQIPSRSRPPWRYLQRDSPPCRAVTRIPCDSWHFRRAQLFRWVSIGQRSRLAARLAARLARLGSARGPIGRRPRRPKSSIMPEIPDPPRPLAAARDLVIPLSLRPRSVFRQGMVDVFRRGSRCLAFRVG